MFKVFISGANWLKSWVPPAGTFDRINFFMLPFNVLLQGEDRGRIGATYATLGLQGHLSKETDPFTKWMKAFASPEVVKEMNSKPYLNLASSQLLDLICKVIVSVGFYATSHISVYTTLSTLLSRSKTVSEIAQPILDGIASIPIPHNTLRYARVIAFAPVIVKLLHIALLAADPDEKNDVLTLFKNSTEKVGRGLEALWSLRFALISLGSSKGPYQLITSTLFGHALNYLPQGTLIQTALLGLNSLIQSMPGETPNTYQSLLSWFLGRDGLIQTIGFNLGLSGIWKALSQSSAPYDTNALLDLFDQVSLLREKIGKPEEVAQVRKLFNEYVQDNKIPPHMASKLNEIIIIAETPITTAEIATQLCKKLQKLSAEGFLMDGVKEGFEAFIFTKVKTLPISLPDAVDFANFLFYYFPRQPGIDDLRTRFYTELKAAIQPLTLVTPDEKKEPVLEGVSEPVKQTSEGDSPEVKTAPTQMENNTQLNAATQPLEPDAQEMKLELELENALECVRQISKGDPRENEWLSIYMQYHIARLNLNLNQYLKMQPVNPEAQRRVEGALCAMVEKIQYHTLPGIKDKIENEKFSFGVATASIPPDFKFATFELAEGLKNLHEYAVKIGGSTNLAARFPDCSAINLKTADLPARKNAISPTDGFVPSAVLKDFMLKNLPAPKPKEGAE